MKNTASFLFLLCWIVCLSGVRANNFSLIKDYKLIINNQTEVKIRQAECQPIPRDKVNISISNNTIIINDTTDKVLLFSVESKDDQVLKVFKEKCLDNLVNANCLDEFIERFYTLFDPFELEYQFYSGNSQISAKLVKDDNLKGLELYPVQVTSTLYLRSPGVLNGPLKVYEIQSGREVFCKQMDGNENSLDLSSLRRGNYVLICDKKTFKFIKF